jgi:hypothetical protein
VAASSSAQYNPRKGERMFAGVFPEVNFRGLPVSLNGFDLCKLSTPGKVF